MSQELVYSRVNTVQQDAARFRQQMAPIISEILKTAPVEVRQKCTVVPVSVSSPDMLLAPSELTHIQSEFERNMTVLKESDNIVRLQASALNTIASVQSQLAVSKPEAITAGLQVLTSATTIESASKAVESVFAEIRHQHTDEFVSGLTTAISGSAAVIGFSNVNIVEHSSTMVRIVAKNHDSQYLVSEIEIGQSVDVHSELVGITDGFCAHTMRKFEEELTIRGVTVSEKEQKTTQGIPQMPFSKKIQKKKSMPNRVFDSCEDTETTKTTIQIKKL